ncbi:hypothetical protein N7475_007219, partial [Penicillium sp. IBT 31633x]
QYSGRLYIVVHSSTFSLFQGRSSTLAAITRDFLPLTTTSATTMSWNPFAIYGIPHDGPMSCYGVTKKGEPCKNSVKVQDTKIGH